MGPQITKSSSAVTIPSLPTESVEPHALCFFVSSYVLCPRDPQAGRGFVELLPLLFANLRANSPLSLCLAAVSRSLFGAWEPRIRDAETFPVRAAYGRALAATRLALQDPEEFQTDETLMAVCLLGFYEVRPLLEKRMHEHMRLFTVTRSHHPYKLCHLCFQAITDAYRSRISSGRHFHGAAALIKQRKDRPITSELFKRLIIAIRSNIVRPHESYELRKTDRSKVFRAIATSSPVDITSELWHDPAGQMPYNPATLLDLMSVDVANVLATADQIFGKVNDCAPAETESSTSTSELILRAKAVDAGLATWPEVVPSSWKPIRVYAHAIPQDVIDAGLYGDSCDIYPDIIICSTWNDWRVARLKVLTLIARLDHGDSSIQAVATIQQLVDETCASVPFSLGSRIKPAPMYAADTSYPCVEGQLVTKTHYQTAAALGGWYLFSPFKEMMKVAAYLRRGQREWIRGQLMRLAQVYDIRHPI